MSLKTHRIILINFAIFQILELWVWIVINLIFFIIFLVFKVLKEGMNVWKLILDVLDQFYKLELHVLVFFALIIL